MALKYSNLEAELGKRKVTYRIFGEAIGCTPETARNKINGSTPITYEEAKKIMKIFFPEYSADYIFQTDSDKEIVGT